jgi:hypothetical protein
MRLPRVLVYLWAFPTSLLGLLFLPDALLSGEACRVDGVLELHGRVTKFFLTHCTLLKGGAAAMTLGHVVIARDQESLDLTVRALGPIFHSGLSDHGRGHQTSRLAGI